MRRTMWAYGTVAMVLVMFAAAASPANAAPLPAPGRWTRPVPGSVVRPFRAPAHPYGPGHRGVDLAAPRGEVVRTAGPGVVTFAGTVAGVNHVVIAHGGGLRTGYSLLASINVEAGQAVTAGMPVGTAGGEPVDGDGHPPGVLHFSLRRGERYLDPMALFRPVDLAAIVHLVPTRQTARTWARKGSGTTLRPGNSANHYSS